MIKELAQWRGRPCPASLLAINCVQSLVYEDAHGAQQRDYFWCLKKFLPVKEWTNNPFPVGENLNLDLRSNEPVTFTRDG